MASEVADGGDVELRENYEISVIVKKVPLVTQELSIGGMTCDHCVQAVRGALREVGGVEDCSVSLATSSASVVCAASVSVEALVDAVEAVGFDGGVLSETAATAAAAAGPEANERTVVVRGMSCGQCETWVGEALKKVEGVVDARVSHASGAAIVAGTAKAARIRGDDGGPATRREATRREAARGRRWSWTSGGCRARRVARAWRGP